MRRSGVRFISPAPSQQRKARYLNSSGLSYFPSDVRADVRLLGVSQPTHQAAMDVFYYWKDVDKDVGADRIGWFQSKKGKLEALKDRHPNYLWVFKTPCGGLGSLQLLARLAWSDSPCTSGAKLRPIGESNIFYDPNHVKSIWYTDSDSEAAVSAVTAWTNEHLSSAVSSNFRGANGQHALERGPVCFDLEKIASRFQALPFLQGIKN